MKKKTYVRLFRKEVMDEVPIFYNFLRKTSKAETEKIEFGDYRRSVSKKHRSTAYLLYEAYKPHTKFNFFKKVIK